MFYRCIDLIKFDKVKMGLIRENKERSTLPGFR